MKKIMLVVALFVCSITLVGCEKGETEVAVLLYDNSDPFIYSVGQYLQEYQNDEINIRIYDSKKSQIVQNEIAEQLYDEGIDLLIINPVERLSSYIFVEKSIQEDVPIIFFNREPLKEDLDAMDDVYYVGANATESGAMQAEMIAEAFGGSTENLNAYDTNGDNIIQCVIFKGEQGHQDAEERTTVVIDALEREGYQVEVLMTQVANWNENEAYRDMEEIMLQYGDAIELLISNNDAMAIGATKYLMDNGYFGQQMRGTVIEVPFVIVGIDGLSEAIDFIKNGYMYGTILNDGNNMANAILELTEYIIENPDKKLNYNLEDDKYIWIPYKNFVFD
ncbi:galactose ABC transporter substrate-binding protein [Vallitaleaceae bacterium 9-2]